MLQVEEGFAYNAIKSITFDKADLKEKTVGQFLESPKFDVPGSGGLQWSIRLYPNGEREDDEDHVSLYLRVSKSVKSKFMFMVPGSTIKKESDSYDCTTTENGCGWIQFASHDEIWPLFNGDKLTIKCFVEFDVLQRCDPPVPLNYQLFRHVPTDVNFLVGSHQVPAHRNFLSLISPVFQAMFSHDNVESKLNKVEIVDFDIITVFYAINYCYGREMKDLSVEHAVDILRFCYEYSIFPVIDELEKWPLLIPSIESFCRVVSYAYDYDMDALLADYCEFYKTHQDEINELDEFAKLPPTLVVDILKEAFDLETNFDVLCHAEENAIYSVVDLLKPDLTKDMYIDNFCSAVNYAWKRDHDDLKQVCAAFLNDNRDDVMDLEDFANLPSETVCEVLKAARALKFGNA